MDRSWFESRQEQEIFSSPKPSIPALGPTQPPIQWVPGFLSRGQRDRGAKLTAHLHLLPRLWMSGAAPRLSLCAFMAWAGKTLSFVTCRCSSNTVAVQIFFHCLVLNLFLWMTCSVVIYCKIYSYATWKVIIKDIETLKFEYNSRIWILMFCWPCILRSITLVNDHLTHNSFIL